MNRILVIDTSTEACSVALQADGVVLEEHQIAPRQHGELALPMVDSLLKEAKLGLSELDCIGFGRGPGAFTGLRICVSIVQGLAFGANLPVVGVSSLQAMAQAAYELYGVKNVASAIDARMGEIYWGLYQEHNGLMRLVAEERVCAPNAVRLGRALVDEEWYGVGTGWETYSQELTEHFSEVALTLEKEVSFPSAKAMLPFVQSEFSEGLASLAESARPVYLRNNVAKKKGEQGKN